MRTALSLALLLLCLLGSSPSLQGDTLLLKDGGKLEGELISRKKGKIRFRIRQGIVTFNESQVIRIVEGQTRFQDYKQRASRLGFIDAPGHYELALWCQQHRLTREMQAEARTVLEIEPEHEGARHLLRQVKVGDRWLTRNAAMRAKGYSYYSGSWYKPEALASLKQKRAARKAAIAARKKKGAVGVKPWGAQFGGGKQRFWQVGIIGAKPWGMQYGKGKATRYRTGLRGPKFGARFSPARD